ncbi:MAG: hypothetical protein JXQ75_00065 [Phycisphaerae bacterium]|nr:hypothetical protein [Phycisphaerae bacterium]
MSTKRIVVVVVLVAGIGIGVYMWAADAGGANGEASVMAMKQTFICSACGKTFEMTVGEVTAMRRAHGGHIYCPYCNAEDPDKQDVLVSVSGMGQDKDPFGSDDEDDDDDDGDDKDNDYVGPRIGPPGMGKKEP